MAGTPHLRYDTRKVSLAEGVRGAPFRGEHASFAISGFLHAVAQFQWRVARFESDHTPITITVPKHCFGDDDEQGLSGLFFVG